MKTQIIATSLVFALTGAASGTTVFGPSAYLSVADSPFATFAGLVNETFEDGLLNADGLSASSGLVTAPGVSTDSVDADDGAIDGSGVAGRSLLSTTSTFIDVTITPSGGQFATYAGLAVTDIGNVNGGPIGLGTVTVQAFDLLGELAATAGPFAFGDGAITGATGEDRFVGFFNAAGISRIRVSVDNSTDWEIDHVQWAVPAPGAGLVLMGAAGLLRRKRSV